MRRDQLTLRSSPFQFLKRLVLIQLIFAFLPFVAALIVSILVGDLGETYAQLRLSRSIPYELMLTILVTTIQLLILIIAFITWYFPVYQIDRQYIIYKRGGFLSSSLLANTPAITSIKIKQGRLAQQMGYGSLHIETADAARRIVLKDIPDPRSSMDRLWDLVEPQAADQEMLDIPPLELVSGGENQHVEFKASLMWDYRQQRVNKELYVPVMKNLAAFMNSSGGYLLIGVDDDGRILGLEKDMQSLRKQDTDGFENTFNQAFNQMVGAEYRQFIDVVFPVIADRAFCLLRVRPSTFPAYLTHKGEESFYIRAGNASQPLSISQAARYIGQRFV